MQDARDSKKRKKTRNAPQIPKKRGENTEKTQQGEPTHPEEGNATETTGEEENAARGTQPTQREKEKRH